MRSMTGFGSSARSGSGISVFVEAKSVNNRYLKVSLRSPAHLSSRESEIEELVRNRLIRGTVQLAIRLHREQVPIRIRMNAEAAREYLRHLTTLAEWPETSGRPDLSILAGLPGVFEAEEEDPEVPDEVFRLVREAVEEALDRLVGMRQREGDHLKADFLSRATRTEELTNAIMARAPAIRADYLARLTDRISALLEARGMTVTEHDLIRELAIYSERSDVTEEVTRLASHLSQFRSALDKEQVGRRLDFLAQEMLREANTIGAKASDVEVSRLTVDLKVELDRLKEQIQNVE